MRLKVLLTALLITSGAATAQVITHEAGVLDNKGQTIGSAKLSGGPGATVIRLSLRAGALSPGWHGIHLHATGNCSDHAKFQASLIKALRDADGTALVIHANPDDHMAQPIGGAGARVACAVIR